MIGGSDNGSPSPKLYFRFNQLLPQSHKNQNLKIDDLLVANKFVSTYEQEDQQSIFGVNQPTSLKQNRIDFQSVLRKNYNLTQILKKHSSTQNAERGFKRTRMQIQTCLPSIISASMSSYQQHEASLTSIHKEQTLHYNKSKNSIRNKSQIPKSLFNNQQGLKDRFRQYYYDNDNMNQLSLELTQASISLQPLIQNQNQDPNPKKQLRRSVDSKKKIARKEELQVSPASKLKDKDLQLLKPLLYENLQLAQPAYSRFSNYIKGQNDISKLEKSQNPTREVQLLNSTYNSANYRQKYKLRQQSLILNQQPSDFNNTINSLSISNSGFNDQLVQLQKKGSLDRTTIKVLKNENRLSPDTMMSYKPLYSKQGVRFKPAARKESLDPNSTIKIPERIVLNSNFNFEDLNSTARLNSQLRIVNRSKLNFSAQDHHQMKLRQTIY
ncbi:UNKNOWN [Stylonychia lemnae]|uniref:Uncharacterized protein n=1 Tax=Stylonychia lemnae TaxID=5949 RepID=A0A077ZTX5_STYLE|nr:UNKNOWN [Stylonychia lemnae]|eukprot:CDW72775.1 UNKNOWN [Stylonychia lemnae]